VKRHGSLDSMNNHRNTPYINNISPVKNKNDMSHIDKYNVHDRNSKINKKENSLRSLNNRCFSEPINLSNDSEVWIYVYIYMYMSMI
jgi:hypothetical protein